MLRSVGKYATLLLKPHLPVSSELGAGYAALHASSAPQAAPKQDPSNAHEFFRPHPEAGGPSKEDEGSAQEVKPGVNTPANAREWKEEAASGAHDLKESAKMSVESVLHKAKDVVEGAKRAVGMQASKPMSNEDMGAAGTQEQAPPQAGTRPQTGDKAEQRAKAEAQYDFTVSQEKPRFKKGEQSVEEYFPDMNQAAEAQSSTPDDMHKRNKQLKKELKH